MPDPNKIHDIKNFKKLFEHPDYKSGYFQPWRPMAGTFETFEKPKPYVKKDQAIKKLTERVEALERLVQITFNGHVLINGQFVKILP